MARNLTPEAAIARAEAVAALRAQGLSIPKVAARLGLSYETLFYWLRARADKAKAREFAAAKRTTRRECMACPASFESEGAHHRLCQNCKDRSHMMSPYEPNPGGSTGRRIDPRFRSGPR